MNIDRWAEEQIQALLDAGVDLDDAQRAVQWVVDRLPPGQDPDTWVPALQLFDAIQSGDRNAIQDARITWMASDDVESRYKRILDATPTTRAGADDSNTEEIIAIAGLLAYLFLTDEGRYYTYPTLTPMRANALVGLFDSHLAGGEQAVQELLQAFHGGQIAPSVWNVHMRSVLQRYHTHFRALGGGGFRSLTDADYLTVNGALLEDFARLRRFAIDVMKGRLSLSQALQRANWYMGTASTHFWETMESRMVAQAGNVILERNILGIADHCSGPPNGCIDYTEMGWQYPGEIPPPRVNRKCGRGCKCRKIYTEVPIIEANQWIGTKRRARGEQLR